MTQAVGHLSPDSVKTSLTRRAALTGMALLAAPTSAAAVCIAPGGEHPIDALWAHRGDLKRRSAAVSASYKAATKALPEWADTGYEFIRKSDGQGYGAHVGWAALEKPLDAGDHLIVRPHPSHIKHWGKKRPRAEYRAAMRDFVNRRRAQDRVRSAAGLTFLENESERLVDETFAVEDQIVRLANTGSDIKAAAAHCVIVLTYAWTGSKHLGSLSDGAAVLSALRAMRPMLDGAIAEEADEMLGKWSVNFDQDDDEA